MTALDIDHVAASNLLFEIADRFATEAGHWQGRSRADLLRMARKLSQHARHALWGGDLAVADAYAEAGRTLIDRVVGYRRFLEVVTEKPRPSSVKEITDEP